MATFTDHLRDRGAAGLAQVLGARPDLAAPPPSTIRSLAARAANRSSLDRALADVDAQLLSVLEAVLALDGTTVLGDGVRVADVAAATGLQATATTPVVERALTLALLWTEEPLGEDVWTRLSGGPGGAGDDAWVAALSLHAAPGLDDVLGPYPAGLGPTLTASLARRTPQALARLAGDLGPGPGPGPAAGSGSGSTGATEPAAATTEDDAVRPEALARRLAQPDTVAALLDQAPPGARAVLAALTWGPPVGRSPALRTDHAGAPNPAREAVDWLLRHGLLAVGDPQHVVLPREIGLALRAGRTHAEPPTAPRPAGRPADQEAVDAESARQAEEAVRLVAALVETWGYEQPPLLRSGGLGTRELRRLAGRLDVTEPLAALVVEVAGAAALVAGDDEDAPALTPTTDADEWLRQAVPERWFTLADAWLTSERAAWLVGTRDDRGTLRAALDPESRRPWAPRLRRQVLGVLVEAGAPGQTDARAEAGTPAEVGTPGAPVRLTPDEVHEVLRWRTPRAVPPLHAVEAVMAEAAALGVLGAGVPSTAGRALLAARTGDLAVGPTTDPAAALAAQLPPAVGEVLLQGDLTGIVPGRPSPELAELLERSARVESRGAGLTVRFTPESVRTALDLGRTAEELLADLSRHARSGVPQPLEYLVLDAARRHGRVRVGVASSYLRSDDPALLTGLVEERALAGLGLLRLAPTVIAAQVPPSALLAALRERGLAPVAEGPSGQVVVAVAPPRRIRRARRGGAGARASVLAGSTGSGPASGGAGPDAAQAQTRRLTRLAKDLLSADRRENALLPGGSGGSSGPGGSGGPGGVGGPGSPDDRRRPGSAGLAGAAPGTPDPVLSLALLREAAAEGRQVWLEIVGTGGLSTRRLVRPVRVDAGRVRAIDTEREAELTVAVHRIANVTPA